MQRTLSFSRLVPGFLEGSTTPSAYLEQCLGAHEERESVLQAFVCTQIAAAREAAAGSTKRYAEGSVLSPVDGMVVAVKDIIDTATLPTQMNSPVFEGNRPAIDAACVRALLKGGAVVLGKSRTTEFAFGYSASTTNPHDATRTPGGSSSGSAAAVGAGIVSGGLATQTQGSTLRPASYCGAAGYKPTHGMLSLEGVHPVSQTLDHLGVIAADVEDAWRIACQISNLNPAPGSPGLPGAEGTPPRPAAPMRVGLLQFEAFSELDAAARQAFDAAVSEIEAAGVAVVRSDADPELRALVAAFDGVWDASLDLASLELRWPYQGYAEAHPGKLGDRILGMLERSQALSRTDHAALLDYRISLRRKVQRLRAEYDAFVFPASSGPAVQGLAHTGSRTFQTPWTYPGLPAWSVPGLISSGLPFGMQLAGFWQDDLRLAGHARWLEALLSPASS